MDYRLVYFSPQYKQTNKNIYFYANMSDQTDSLSENNMWKSDRKCKKWFQLTKLLYFIYNLKVGVYASKELHIIDDSIINKGLLVAGATL